MDDRRVVAGLSRGVFDLDDPGELLGAGVVHLHRGLPETPPPADGLTGHQLFLRERLVAETQRPIGERAEAVVVELVDRSSEDHVVERHVRHDIPVVGVEEEPETGTAGRHHPFEQPGVAGLRQGLKRFSQVTVVTVGADRNPAADTGVEIAWVAPPLLERVALEELFVQERSDLGENHLLGVPRFRNGDPMFRQPGLHLVARRTPADQLLERVEIDGKPPVPLIRIREDLVIDGPPVGELREIRHDFRGVRPKVVRAVGMNEDAMIVVSIGGVAADLRPLLDDEATLAALRREPLGHRQACEPGTDDQVVELPCHGRVPCRGRAVFRKTSKTRPSATSTSAKMRCHVPVPRSCSRMAVA